MYVLNNSVVDNSVSHNSKVAEFLAFQFERSEGFSSDLTKDLELFCFNCFDIATRVATRASFHIFI